MARRRTHSPLNIFLNNRLVGRLAKAPSGAIEFAYDRSWLDWEHALPVSLSLQLREARYTGAAVAAVFDNLLPDAAPIRTRLAERVTPATTTCVTSPPFASVAIWRTTGRSTAGGAG